MGHGGKPWVSDFNDPNYVAGRNAVKTGTFYFNKINWKKYLGKGVGGRTIYYSIFTMVFLRFRYVEKKTV